MVAGYRVGSVQRMRDGFRLLDGDLAPELSEGVSKRTHGTESQRVSSKRGGKASLTSGASSVLFNGFSLLDELVLGGGETALDGGADGGSAELSGQARGGAEHQSLKNHGEIGRMGVGGRVFLVAN